MNLKNLNKLAYVLWSHVVAPAVHFTLKECLSQIGLAYAATCTQVNKLSTAI